MITAGQGPSPPGILSAAGQIPSAVSISTERCVTITPFVVLVLGPYRQQRTQIGAGQEEPSGERPAHPAIIRWRGHVPWLSVQLAAIKMVLAPTSEKTRTRAGSHEGHTHTPSHCAHIRRGENVNRILALITSLPLLTFGAADYNLR
jgi:hypothetical protein